MSASPTSDPATQMRIHVGKDGDVEFSVSLTASVDPSLVATMVAAVRAGIVASPAPSSLPPAKQTLPQLPSPPSSHTSTNPSLNNQHHHHHQQQQQQQEQQQQPHPHPREPSSDPDPDPEAEPLRHPDRPESPLISNPPSTLSVRQIAAQLDAGEHSASDNFRYSTPLHNPPDHAQYDSVREFSSSPSLWLSAEQPNSSSQYTRNSDRSNGTAPTSRSQPDTTQPSQPSQQQKHKQQQQPQNHLAAQTLTNLDIHPTRSIHPDREEAPHGAVPNVPNPFATRPIRMHSLPSGSKYHSVNDMYFGDDASSSHDPQPRSFAAIPSDRISQDDDQPDDETTAVTPLGTLFDRSRRDRRRVVDVYDKGASSMSASKLQLTNPDRAYYDPENDRADTPTSPYVQASEAEDDADDAWDNVEYVLTESYRERPRESDTDRDGRTPRSGTWRLFASLGGSFARRKTDADEDIHQNTLATGGVRHRNENMFAVGKPRRYRPLFGRGAIRNGGGVWFEFSSPSSEERMISEVGKIAKAVGYQVWKRPGENKLRCIRRLNHRHEMHMVIFVGSVRLPEGLVSVVRLKRAKGDRNKTEAWRFSHFYRELIERLQRHGIEISSEV